MTPVDIDTVIAAVDDLTAKLGDHRAALVDLKANPTLDDVVRVVNHIAACCNGAACSVMLACCAASPDHFPGGENGRQQ